MGSYYTRIDLQGVEFVSDEPCRVDFNSDGFIDFFDFADYVRAFEEGC